VRTKFPGMNGAVAVVHASEALGAKFTQYTAEFEPGGTLGSTNQQRFVYVLEGELASSASGENQVLKKDGYAFFPQGTVGVKANTEAKAVVIEKEYQPLADTPAPKAFVSHAGQIQSTPLMDDEALQVWALLPDSVSFDFAVNLMEYELGASLSMTEIHIMEHGLLMLQGGGIYKLGDSWYPVSAGDFIWMAPYCPQWFGALGKEPAKYIIYKDWNR
jgi:(S)-ureidoglycine aminohydrolase